MKKENEIFKKQLYSAQNGDSKMVEKIIEMYMPLINKRSIINGKLNEDLRQTIILHIIKKLKKFKIK